MRALLRRVSAIGALAAICLSNQILLTIPGARAQQGDSVEASAISGSNDKPRRHTRIKNTEELTDQEAEQVYRLISGALRQGFGASGEVSIDGYQSNNRFNTAPYRSAAHGNQYVNNYANQLGNNYGEYENAENFTVGTRLYKDSFSVAANGSIILGSLFIMEKMPQGFNKISGDWKYVQIQPTGDIVGETQGINAGKVDYCIACHLAREHTQHLFFVPEDYRN